MYPSNNNKNDLRTLQNCQFRQHNHLNVFLLCFKKGMSRPNFLKIFLQKILNLSALIRK